MSRTTTNYVIPPGWTLNEEMESRGMTPDVLASLLSISLHHLSLKEECL